MGTPLAAGNAVEAWLWIHAAFDRTVPAVEVEMPHGDWCRWLGRGRAASAPLLKSFSAERPGSLTDWQRHESLARVKSLGENTVRPVRQPCSAALSLGARSRYSPHCPMRLEMRLSSNIGMGANSNISFESRRLCGMP